MPNFTSIEYEFMREAIKEAEHAAICDEVPAGAVIVDENGLIMGRGRNQVISLNDPSAHAEILAMRQASGKIGNYRLLGFTLFSTLEPCPMCLMAAIHARLKRVVFGAREPRWGAAGSLLDLAALDGLNHRLAVDGGLLADEAGSLISDFFKKKRAQKKIGTNFI